MSMYLGNQKVKPFIIGDDGIKYIWDENIDFSQPIDVTGYKKFSVNGGLIDDGHARIWVDMNDENDLTITVRFNTSSNKQVINWGDGNIETFSDATASRTRSHTYAQIGKYIIDISSNNNSNYNALGQYIANQDSDTTMRNKVIYVEDNAMDSFTWSNESRFRYLTSLKSVKFGSNFQFSNNKIPGYTCRSCTALENFDFHGATIIGSCAFEDCSSLKLIALPESITEIGSYAFENCTSLALTTLPSNLLNLSDRAFYNCTSLAITSLPETITSYGGSIFYGCTGLTTMTLPESMTTMPGAIFNRCTNLTTVTFPSNLTNISNSAFYNCFNLVLTSLPDTITTISNNAFSNCSKIAITTLPSALTTIGSFSFQNCTSLTVITIPAGVTTINNNAFSGDTKLTSVTILATTPPALNVGGMSVFPYSNTGFKIYVPAASLDTYKSATNWSELASYMEAIPT